MKSGQKRFKQLVNPLEMLKTKKVLQNNPTVSLPEIGQQESVLTLYTIDENKATLTSNIKPDDIVVSLFEPNKNYWLNLDILNSKSVEIIGRNIGLHPLLIEDILSINQRAKTDEINNLFSCVLHMLYFNESTNSVESEQVSFVLGENFLISFQDDCIRDLFNPVRERLTIPNSRIRMHGPDYLLYSLIDSIVDHYFVVLDKLAIQIEALEEEISSGNSGNKSMNQINDLRKEIMFFKRHVHPVRELMNGIIRSESPMINERTNKYFKDIYDHIIQANDLCETYRDVITNIRDLYLSQVNIKMNEVMKFLTIVTALLAPATVIGGIFGMNFDTIPYLHNHYGFWIATILMLIAPIIMMFYFKKKDWF